MCKLFAGYAHISRIRRTLFDSVFDQPDAEPVASQYDRIIDSLSDTPSKVADHLKASRPDLLAFNRFSSRSGARSPEDTQQGDPAAHRRRRHLPDRNALIRLVRAALAEQHDEWAESRRYVGLDALSKSRADHISPTEQEDVPAALTAWTITSKNHTTTSYTTSLNLTLDRPWRPGFWGKRAADFDANRDE